VHWTAMSVVGLLTMTAGDAGARSPDPSAPSPIVDRTSLGLGAERFDPFATARPRERGEQCVKWRRLADRLGETYAGYRIRTSVLREMCGMLLGDTVDDAWSWPWSGLARGSARPPRHVKTYGAWELRCGRAGKRRRCTLVAALLGEGTRADGEGAAGPVAHFVIDTIAGRELVLFRLLVPGETGVAVSEAARHGAPTSSDAAPTRTAGSVSYRIGGREHTERFSMCSRAGCVMEAGIGRGGGVVTRLWDGNRLTLVIEPPARRRIELTLPANGFRKAFVELVRLRREERRGR